MRSNTREDSGCKPIQKFKNVIMKKKIIFITQAKGGSGKSVLTFMIRTEPKPANGNLNWCDDRLDSKVSSAITFFNPAFLVRIDKVFYCSNGIGIVERK